MAGTLPPFKPPGRYVIVTRNRQHELTAAVEQFLEKGYVLAGGVVIERFKVDGNGVEIWHQTMVLPKSLPLPP